MYKNSERLKSLLHDSSGSAADICKMGMIMVVQSLETKDLNPKARFIK